MKISLFTLLLFNAFLSAAEPIILDEVAIHNLRLKTVEANESTFEQTVFCLGHIRAIPQNMAAVSSRVSGRILSLAVSPGQSVEAGQILAEIESRQAGDPPAKISLRAPAGGMVTQVLSRLGDPVEPEKAFIEIIDLTDLFVHASVPEHQAGKMKIGAQASIHIPAVPDHVITGKLLRFATSANHKSGSIDAVFQISNQDGRIRPEMCVEVSITTAKREDVLSIPRDALQGEPSERHVFVKDFDLPNAFIKAPVKVGEMNERMVEIVSGVFPGDDVVTQGAYSLGFVGKGSISLKEALDAAHGHEHAVDGSELGHEEAEHDHDHGHVESPLWKISSAVLSVLLLITLFLLKKSISSQEAR